jgi:hypothetical protein
MDGDGDFNFFNFDFDEEMNVLEELPFGKFMENNKINKENNFFNFLKINYTTNTNTTSTENLRQIHGEDIIEKINLLERNYSEIIVSSPTQSINFFLKFS